jgi:hypothetical protein
MCRVCKYSLQIEVRFVRVSARGDVQSAVATFYSYAKIASDVTGLNLRSMAEAITDQIENFYLYNPWWDMNRIVRASVCTAACAH